MPSAAGMAIVFQQPRPEFIDDDGGAEGGRRVITSRAEASKERRGACVDASAGRFQLPSSESRYT